MEKLYRGNLVTIIPTSRSSVSNVEFQAHLRTEIEYDIRVHYDSLFNDVLKWRETVGKALVGIEELSSVLGEAESFFTARVLTTGLSWTRKFGGIPGHLEFTLPCRLWIEDDVDEINNKLSKLYTLSVPDLGRYVTTFVPPEVMINIGGWFVLDRAFITNIAHRWSKTMVEGVPSYCDVDISITSVYAIDRSQIDVSRRKIQVRSLEGQRRIEIR